VPSDTVMSHGMVWLLAGSTRPGWGLCHQCLAQKIGQQISPAERGWLE
jgi:hypothetical protein